MRKVVGIRFKTRGKVYDFGCGHFVLKKGDKVMVITDEGPAIGAVCTEPNEMEIKDATRPLKDVYRLATEEEIKRYEKGAGLEDEVYRYCYKRIQTRNLAMSLVSVERLFDGSKVIVYFTADGRIDFRELVKDLVRRFRTRIEMRQIGVRHQAKMVGGLGPCGRILCCASFLNKFDPVTIKMAKEQNISLNPSKISGMCGRLMCCLTYEHAFYEKIKRKLPRVGKKITVSQGTGKVIRLNALKEILTVQLAAGEEVELTFDDLIREGIVKDRSRKE